jgi:deoxycytidylate deaminase
MRRIEGEALETIQAYFVAAGEVAERALCLRARCGSVIVKDGVVIGEGYNAPPLDDAANRTCDESWDTAKKPKYDKTCCIHAEWNAVLNACKQNPNYIEDSTLYFMRVDEAGKFTDAGEPYCTTCSRLTLQSGVTHFALWNKGGADVYEATEYNRLSYEFYRPA